MTNEELQLNAYLVLECKPGCTKEELKSSYRELVKVWHPDRFESDSKLKLKATEKLKLINEAYQLLCTCFDKVEISIDPVRNSRSTKRPEQNNERTKVNKADDIYSIINADMARVFNSPNSDRIFYVRDLKEVILFEDGILNTGTKATISIPVNKGVDYQNAGRSSMSFMHNLKEGKMTKVPPQQGLSDEFDNYYWSWRSDNYTEYAFSDGSTVRYLHSKIKLTHFDGRVRINWHKQRSGVDEITEDFQYFKNLKNWKLCALYGQKAIDLHSTEPWGWISRAYALHSLALTESALWGLKYRAIKQFPTNILIHYNAACYSAKLGEQKAAKAYLKQAFMLALKQRCFDQYHNMALNDSDLIPIRGSVSQIAILSKIGRFF